MAEPTDKQLRKRDAARDIGAELLEAVRDMKRGRDARADLLGRNAGRMLHFVGFMEDRLMNTPTRTPKQQAHELIDQLPDTATWRELAYTLEVRADIEEGLTDIEAGRVSSVAEIRREYGLRVGWVKALRAATHQ